MVKLRKYGLLTRWGLGEWKQEKQRFNFLNTMNDEEIFDKRFLDEPFEKMSEDKKDFYRFWHKNSMRDKVWEYFNKNTCNPKKEEAL